MSLLPVLSKLYERAMSSIIVDYLTKFSIVTPLFWDLLKEVKSQFTVTETP